jgi:hypothetical protein
MRLFLVAFVSTLLVCALVPRAQELPQVLVSRQLAELEGLAEGDTIRLGSDASGTRARDFRIAAIYEPTPDPARLGSIPREVRLHLPDLLSLTLEPAGAERVDTINVALVDPG